MLKKVRKAGFAGLFPAAADMKNGCDRHNRVRVIGMQDDLEAIVERVFFIIDTEFGFSGFDDVFSGIGFSVLPSRASGVCFDLAGK